MSPIIQTPAPPRSSVIQPKATDETWVTNAALLWANRRTLARAGVLAFVLSTVVSLLLPNQYQAATSIMPPEQTSGNAALLASIVGKSSGGAGGLASLAGGLLGGRSSGALFVSLLRSGTVSNHLIDRFQLQHVYRKRYMQDTGKMLARKTTISEDSKSGVLTIQVEDKSRERARDMAQAYLDELNALVAQVNTSSARREREFIEQRLQSVQKDLQQAQVEMSEFSTRHTAIDIKEQTRAMVDAGAKMQAQLVVGESELDSLRQIYGDQNVRVRSAEARVGVLRRELERASGGGGLEPSNLAGDDAHPYPALRQLPALAVPWANLYRRVRIQETVYELLSAQYETSRIEEAKSIPTVRVIDPPGLPEKKSSPHRLILVAGSTLFALAVTSLWLLVRRSWQAIDAADTRKVIAREMSGALESYLARWRRGRR